MLSKCEKIALRKAIRILRKYNVYQIELLQNDDIRIIGDNIIRTNNICVGFENYINKYEK